MLLIGLEMENICIAKGMGGNLLIPMILWNRYVSCPKCTTLYHFTSLSSHLFSITKWRHNQGKPCELLALYDGNLPPINHPHKEALMFSLWLLEKSCCITSWITSDLTRHGAHVMSLWWHCHLYFTWIYFVLCVRSVFSFFILSFYLLYLIPLGLCWKHNCTVCLSLIYFVCISYAFSRIFFFNCYYCLLRLRCK